MIDNKISPHYTMNVQNIYLSSKPHYEILDGLRGVAAAMVVAFHLLEAHSGGNHLNQIINHGYLAVDFFFMLSGFVIGYAYDDRWNRMSMGTFFKRRLIRLQPMVAMGSIVGAALFWFQKAPCYPAMEGVSIGALLLVKMGYSRMDGNAPAERTGVVALLRIHREHTVRTIYSQVQQNGAGRLRGNSSVLYGTPLPYRTRR